MQQQDVPVGAVAVGGGLEEIHELHERAIEAEDGVSALIDGVGEEPVADVVVLQVGVGLDSKCMIMS